MNVMTQDEAKQARLAELLPHIVARMVLDGATSDSDEDIEKTLRPCCAPAMLIKCAKILRESGKLLPAIQSGMARKKIADEKEAAAEREYNAWAALQSWYKGK